MLDSWNECIFHNIKFRLQESAMKLVHAERNGEAFDSQLVIGVRESYGRFNPFNCFNRFGHFNAKENRMCVSSCCFAV